MLRETFLLSISSKYNGDLKRRKEQFFLSKTLQLRGIMQIVELPLFNELHAHFRDGEMRNKVVPYTSRIADHGLGMPNLKPPIVTGQDALEYKARLLTSVGAGHEHFKVLMTIKILDVTTPDIVKEAKEYGVVAGKVYPRGATTNAEDGIADFSHPDLRKVFRAMEECDMVLSLHGELPEPAEVMAAESGFVHEVLPKLARDFPNLRIVLEHMTTEDAVQMVTKLAEKGRKVAGTITAHHLEMTHSHVLRGKLKVHRHCLPFPKWNRDMEALWGGIASGVSWFFMGSDTAPHAKHTKECAEACAGCYSAPVLAQCLAEAFEKRFPEDWAQRLSKFATYSGADFYNLPYPTKTFKLKKESWQVPLEIDGVVPYKYGETLAWQLVD